MRGVVRFGIAMAALAAALAAPGAARAGNLTHLLQCGGESGPDFSFESLSQEVGPIGTDRLLTGLLRQEHYLANADYRVLRALSAVDVSNDIHVTASPANSAVTRAYARWDDTVNIDRAQLTGQQGIATMQFTITGKDPQAGAVSDDYALARVEIGFDFSWGASTTSGSYKIDTDFGPSGKNFVGQTILVDVAFIFGQDTPQSMTIQTNTQAGVVGNGAGFASADLSHTLVWGGFVSVRDGSGNIVNDYTVESGSGVDWSQPVAAVPEPSTLASCSLIAVALAGYRLRRRKAA